MRAHLIARVGSIAFAACAPSEATAPSASGSPRPAASVSATVSAASVVAAAAAPSASAAAILRDANAELERLDPLADGPDAAEKVLAALALCSGGVAPSGARGRASTLPAVTIEATRCEPAVHAKLLLKSASLWADSADDEKRKTAEHHGALALALDPAATLPPSASTAATALFATAKQGPARFGMRGSKPSARLGAVTASDEATRKQLESASAGEVSSAVRFCYTMGLFDNPNLQGAIAIVADVAADGRLSAAIVSGDLPDAAVNVCISALVNRSKVAAPAVAPAKVKLPFMLSPSGG